MTEQDINWGPSGESVYRRTYSRKKANGENETWPETVRRVVGGNLALVYGGPMGWSSEVHREHDELVEHIESFKILPAGRHLWASGVKGRQFLMNCWTSGWGDRLSDHAEFTFMRLMEGGGVGSNYSTHHLTKYGTPRRQLEVHIVCDPQHPDYPELEEAGLLSPDYDSEWDGAFETEDSREGWAAGLTDLIDTFMTDDDVKHERRVFDVSRVRCRGSRLKTFGGTASGPAPYARMLHEVAFVMNSAQAAGQVTEATQLDGLALMEIDHAIAECVVSGGNRRSARMAMVRWDDPQIFEFIRCKQGTADNPFPHYTTNISIEIDDEFTAAIGKSENAPFTIRELLARKVHGAAVKAMLTNGEPGYWNSTLSNHGELRDIYCTNPCGEITLEEWEACNLGHINLDAFAPSRRGESPNTGGLIRAHELVTRFLIRATFADINDPKSREVQDRNRRIGVGHFGVQGFLVKQGIRFSEAPSHGEFWTNSFAGLLSDLKQVVRRTARTYAFELRIAEPIKTTTVAPTGTIAKMPGVTEGIHPVLYRFFERRIRFSKSDADQAAQLEDYRAKGFTIEDDVYDESGMTAVVVIPTKELLVEQVEALGYQASIVETAYEIGLEKMLEFQAMYQTFYADNAVSFTVNVPADLYSTKEAADIIGRYLPQLKGTTIFPDAGMAQSPYTEISELEYNLSQVKSIEDSTDEDCATGACPIR